MWSKKVQTHTVRTMQEAEVRLRVFEIADETVRLGILEGDAEARKAECCTHNRERAAGTEHYIGTELQNGS